MGRVFKIGSKLLTFKEETFDLKRWVQVENYLVAPEYIYPVQIGHAAEIARLNGCELPSRELVDAIFQAADLRVAPIPLKHNGTWAQMASSDAYQKHEELLQIQMCLHPEGYKLLVGTHKDIIVKNGKAGLYGWHQPNGKVIQPPFFGHGNYWIDYSQGLRLVKKIAT